MIDRKLIVDRYIHFTRPTFRDLTGRPPVFEPVTCPPLTIQESGRYKGGRKSDVAAGANATKQWRNFKFLPWYQGDIAETTLDCDVLTGPMSGCILTSYRRGANLMVGHVGTVTVTEAVPQSINDNVKALWNGFATANPRDVIGGFNPCGRSVPAHPPATKSDSGGEVWGLFTTEGTFYAVNVYSQTSNAAYWRIAGIHQVPSMSLYDLQNL